MGEARYHVQFKDGATGEQLGLLLGEGQIGYRRQLVNPYAAKGAQGTTRDSDLTEWSVLSQRDWRGGRGQEIMQDRTAFMDAWNVETRVEEQFTLGPLPQNPAATNPQYEPGSVSRVAFGYPGPEKNIVGGLADREINLSNGWAQRFRVYGGPFDYKIASIDVRIKKDGAVLPINLRIRSDNDGKPGSQLAVKQLTASSVATSYGWVTFTLATPLDVHSGYGGRYYWISLDASTGSGKHYVWDVNTLSPYGSGYMAHYSNDAWSLETNDDATFRVHWQSIALEQSFVAPGGGLACTLVQLLLKKVKDIDTVRVRLYDDSGGSPDTLMDTTTATVAYVANYLWCEAVWTGTQTLTGSAVYHIVADFAAEQTDRSYYCIWGGQAGYATGDAQEKYGAGAWAGITEDLYFRTNRDALDDDVVGFARYEGAWYCAAGDTVYKFGSNIWNVSDAVAAKMITDIEVWGGYLWVARGSDNYIRQYDDSSWADVGTLTAHYLKAGGGYLNRTGATGNRHKVYYTADGTTWSAAIEVGAGDYEITGLEWYRDMLVAATPVRLWGLIADAAYPLLDWNTQEDANNGKRLLNWSRTGCLYIPLRFGLYRWNGDTMVAVGPEQGTGLPAARAGRIADLVGTGNWLYAAIDADTGGTSSILAYNGMGGWHEIQRAEQSGQQVLALGFETINSPNRLWYGMGAETRYLMLPDYSDNPWGWSGYEFNASGSLETSWMGNELLEVVKDLHQVVVRGEGFADAQPVEVFYEVDRSGIWTLLGEVTEAPRQALTFTATEASRKTITTQSTYTTIEVDTSDSDTGDLAQGDWVRINGEVAQVDSITDSGTFVLATALSVAPLAGDIVYPAQATGREFRLKLGLSTEDKASTPKVTAVFVRYQNNVLDRFLWVLQVQVQDGLKDLAGSAYPYTAAELRAELDTWAERVTPFLLVDPDERAYTVKVVSAAEAALSRKAPPGQLAGYNSIYTINLVEV